MTSTFAHPSGDTADAYAQATAVFNLAAPAEPALALTARSVDDVEAAVRQAVAEGRKIRVHTTGHASARAKPMADALLIRTQLAAPVEVDVERRIARVPAGAVWGDVIAAAAPHGLAAPHGSSPLVGVVGYLLNGGVSFYGRHTGLAVNSVRAVELVTADGAHVRADADTRPELFDALRGGGGGLGVVTAVEVALFPAAHVVTGAAWWPASAAADLLRLWLKWTTDAQPVATTSFRLMNLPKLPVIPPELSAGPVVCMDGVVLAETDADLATAQAIADDLLAPLRGVAEPIMSGWQVAQPPAVAYTHMDPMEPFPLFGDHFLIADLDEPAVDAFVQATGPESGSPLTNVELRQLGGAFSTPVDGGGVLDHLPGRFAYLGGGVPFGPVTPAAITAHCAQVRSALAPWAVEQTAPSLVEHREQPQRHLDAATVAAVDAVRAQVDPDRVFADDIAPNTTACR